MNKRMTANEHIVLLQKASAEALDKNNYLLGYASTLCERLNEVCARLDRLETNVQTDDRWKLQQELAQMRKERDEARRERDYANAKYEEAAHNMAAKDSLVERLKLVNRKLWERLDGPWNAL